MTPAERTLRRVLNQPRVRAMFEASLTARELAQNHHAGDSAADTAEVAERLHARGLLTTLARSGAEAATRDEAVAGVDDCLRVFRLLGGQARWSGVTIGAHDLGLAHGARFALTQAARLGEAVHAAGASWCLDLAPAEATDDVLVFWRRLRADFPEVGLTVSAWLRRTERDLAEIAEPEARIRLSARGWGANPGAAHSEGRQMSLAFVRCMRTLMASAARPSIATHDPRLIEIALHLAAAGRRRAGDHEYLMLMGVRPLEQRRLADLGHTSRVYVPFGPDWYASFARQLAQRPVFGVQLVRALVARR